MKQKFLIIALLVFSLMVTLSYQCNAQSLERFRVKVLGSTLTDSNGTVLSKSTLIADETTLNETKTGARIESNSQVVTDKIITQFEKQIKRAVWKWGKDRHGAYKIYVLYVDKETANQIKEWAKINL